MTALVVVEAGLPLDEKLTIGRREDIDTEKNTCSRLQPGTVLTRGRCCTWPDGQREPRGQCAGAPLPGGLQARVEAR